MLFVTFHNSRFQNNNKNNIVRFSEKNCNEQKQYDFNISLIIYKFKNCFRVSMYVVIVECRNSCDGTMIDLLKVFKIRNQIISINEIITITID